MLSPRMSDDCLRILDLRDSPWVDGPGRTVLEIAEALNGAEIEYIICSMRADGGPPGAYAEEARRRCLPHEEIRERGPFDFRVVSQINEILSRRRIHIVHTHEFRSDVFGLICARFKGARLVSTVHGWIGNNLTGKCYSMLDKLLLRFFDRIVVVSQKLKRQLMDWGIPERKITVVPNALKIGEYRSDRSDDGFRREFSLGPETTLIGNIGRLSPEKGQADFLRAARDVLQRCEQARFALIGVGPDEAMLRALARDLGIADRVIFAGYRRDMLRVYNSLDLVVQSSFTEGMPNVILEALLMTVPVIATDVGGTAEVVEHESTGVLLPPGQPQRLAAEILRFVHDKAGFQAQAARGRERVARDFSSARRIEQMTEVFRSVLK